MKNEISQVESSIDPRDLQRRLAEGCGARLIDVRTPGEFAAGHVSGSHLIPLDDLNPEVFRSPRGDARPVYVLCQSGRRARKAIASLEAAGVGDCVLVEGGMQGWMDAGLPVVRSKHEGLPLMRQVQIIAGSISAVGAIVALTISPYFALVPLVIGCGLVFAGATGMCGLALLLAKMPWNRLGNRGGQRACEEGGAS